jgi:hypothetical protein
VHHDPGASSKAPFFGVVLAGLLSCSLVGIAGASAHGKKHHTHAKKHHVASKSSSSDGCSYVSAAVVTKLLGSPVVATSDPTNIKHGPVIAGCSYVAAALSTQTQSIITSIYSTSELAAMDHGSPALDYAAALKSAGPSESLPGIGSKAFDLTANGGGFVHALVGSYIVNVIGPGQDAACRAIAKDIADKLS